MDSAKLLQEARLGEALGALKDEVRSAPAQVELRVRLFGLNCVLGRLENAATDLDVIQSLDQAWIFPAQVYRRLIAAELLRREVFAGRAHPTILGEPEPWTAWNVQALSLAAAGQAEAALNLNLQAWETAPELPCVVDGHSCRWLADADRRLGPVLEACLDGKYYWIPFGRVQTIEPRAPEFLVERVWLPAKLILEGGVEVQAQLPARYPDTENASDGRVCLGLNTDWVESADGARRPVGQKLFESEDTEFDLSSCHLIEFGTGSVETQTNA